MKTRGLATGLLSIVLFAVCGRITAPLPAGTIGFSPPSVYRTWWKMTEACSGRVADFSAVSWYILPGTDELPDSVDGVGGRWYARGDRILLAGGEEWDGSLVRHEMLHALLGAVGHPRAAFIGDCRGVVVCIETCISDGGPPPPADPSALGVLPSALDVEARVSPIPPIDTADGGYFMLVVTARNPDSTPVVVHLPPTGDSGPPVTFGFRILATASSGEAIFQVRAGVPEDSSFAPGETKEYVFDFHIVPNPTTPFEIAPGTYRFIGEFGYEVSDSQPTVTIGR